MVDTVFMFLFEIRGQKGFEHMRGWIVALSQAEAADVARREHATLNLEPIADWKPLSGAKVIWLSPHCGTSKLMN